jgi:hypothetical protein
MRGLSGNTACGEWAELDQLASGSFKESEAGGMVEIPSLSKLENVDPASATGAFAGFTLGKKSKGSLHAVLWAPSSASSRR